MKIRGFILGLLLWPVFSLAVTTDMYHFSTPSQAARFDHLTTELRCLVCQNQNLAESNAGLANDLRDEVYHQIQSGQSDQQIIAYLVARYGDFILYRPRWSGLTVLLWLAPISILCFGLGYLFYYIRQATLAQTEDVS